MLTRQILRLYGKRAEKEKFFSATAIFEILFVILVDESSDISSKKQMTIVLRYVDKGHVIERFVGIVYVTNIL